MEFYVACRGMKEIPENLQQSAWRGRNGVNDSMNVNKTGQSVVFLIQRYAAFWIAPKYH